MARTAAAKKPSKVDSKVIELDTDAIRARELEVARESDESIIARMRERFEILTEMTKAVKQGHVRAMIVSGPPGVGKSFGVESVLEKYSMLDQLAAGKKDSKAVKYEIVKGTLSSIGLYSKLYEFSGEKNVIVFDDADGIFYDTLSLNLLKAALDTSKKRFINWNTDSRILRSEGIPDRFEFKGSVIFISNIKFSHVRSKTLKEHLTALESRCHYIDLEIDTMREKILRIRQVIEDNGMLDDYEFEPAVRDEVVEFVESNAERFREVSLRTILKVSDLRKTFPTKWKEYAKHSLMFKV
jgi:hypothetical protein